MFQLVFLALLVTVSMAAQTATPPTGPGSLPANRDCSVRANAKSIAAARPGPGKVAGLQERPVRLTVQDAEALALKNNPQISVYRLLHLASKQVTRQQQAAYYPNIYGSLTAVEPGEGATASPLAISIIRSSMNVQPAGLPFADDYRLWPHEQPGGLLPRCAPRLPT